MILFLLCSSELAFVMCLDRLALSIIPGDYNISLAGAMNQPTARTGNLIHPSYYTAGQTKVSLKHLGVIPRIESVRRKARIAVAMGAMPLIYFIETTTCFGIMTGLSVA